MISINRKFASLFTPENRENIDYKALAKKHAPGWEHGRCYDINKLASIISKIPWSPIVWENGYRAKKNFISAYWCALDFDSGELTLDQAVNNVFCDYKHIIATTKHHQIEKDGLPPCDRFRVIVPFEYEIKNLKQYEQTLVILIRNVGADTACSDGGRFMWPSFDIVSINDDTEGFTADVLPIEMIKKTKPKRMNLEKIRKRPISIKTRRLIDNGCKQGMRNESCFAAAAELFEKGLTEDQIRKLIFPKLDPPFDSKEEDSIIKSAFKRVAKNIEGSCDGRRS